MKKGYQFQFSSYAEKDFASLEKFLQTRILKKLVFWEKSKDPLSFAKKLQGMNDKFSFRVGNYRVIVAPKDEKIFVILLILKIGHRREVYG